MKNIDFTKRLQKAYNNIKEDGQTGFNVILKTDIGEWVIGVMIINTIDTNIIIFGGYGSSSKIMQEDYDCTSDGIGSSFDMGKLTEEFEEYAYGFSEGDLDWKKMKIEEM